MVVYHSKQVFFTHFFIKKPIPTDNGFRVTYVKKSERNILANVGKTMINKSSKIRSGQQNQHGAVLCYFIIGPTAQIAPTHNEVRNFIAVRPIQRTLGFKLLTGLLLMCFCTVAVGQSTVTTEFIALQSGPLPFTPEEFYIADVIDERDNRTAVGHLLLPRSSTTQPVVTYPVDLKGGAATAIGQFIRQSLAYNDALHPVVARIKECVITEIPGASGRVDGRVVLTISFDLQRDGETVHLVEYHRGGARYNRPANSRSHIAAEKAFRQSLVGALRYLNTWFDQEAAGNPLLAKEIKVSFTDYTENVDEDTVFYATDRPLTWNDFRERPRLERYAASVFPSFGYESYSEVVNGILHINITLKVYVIPDYSWVKGHAKDAYSLNHEQRHFDIVKLIAERFKQKVQADTLTVDNFNNILQWQYIDSYREMNHLQEQYDDETRHGTNPTAQERWNQYIDEELRAFAVKEQKAQ